MNRRTAELYLLLVTFLWGWSFPLMKMGLNYISTLNFLTYRFIIATLVIYIIYQNRVFIKETFIQGTILGLIFIIGQGLQTLGLNYTTASNSAFLTSLSVIFAPFIGRIILGEKLKWKYIILLLQAIIGVYFLTGLSTNSLNIGDMMTIICAVAFGFQIVLVQKYTMLRTDTDIVSLVFWQTLTNAIFYIFITFFTRDITFDINPVAWIAILYTGILTTSLTLIIQFKYQKITTVQRASLIYTLEPLFGYLTALLLLGEVLTLNGYIGAALIFTALILQEISP